MSPNPPDNNTTPPLPSPEEQPEGTLKGSSHSHQRHSHRHRSSSGRHHSSKRFRFRLEEQPAQRQLRRTEKILARQFLAGVGILLILGAILFLINSSTPISDIIHMLTTKSVSVVKDSSITLVSSEFSEGMIMTAIITILFIASTVVISVRLRSLEAELLAFVTYFIFSGWMLITLLTTASSAVYLILIFSSSAFFVVFFLCNILFPNYNRSTWVKKAIEVIIIGGNVLFYYVQMVFLLQNYGHRYLLLPLTLAIILFSGLFFSFANTRKIEFRKVPYQIAAGFLMSMVIPLIFRMEEMIIFLSVFSIFLMIYAKSSGHQASVLFSLFTMAIFFFLYLFNWIFNFFPIIFRQSSPPETTLFFQGLLAGIFVILAITINSQVLKKIHVSYSKKWFDVSKNRLLMKGMLLVAVFLASFWIYHYGITFILLKQYLKPLFWFIFFCSYLIVTIILLARQRSTYLPLIFVLACITLLYYPVMVHSHVVSILDNYLGSDPSFLWAFFLHYADVAVMLVLLFVLLRFVHRSVKGVKGFIRAYWVYMSAMLIFLALSEFDHLMVITNYYKGIKIDETIDTIRKIPYSLLIVFSAILILALGFIRKSRFLRIYSLFILLAVIVKVLVVDVPNLDTNSIVLVFMFLGLLLLVISYFYSRIKHFFLSDSGSHTSGSRSSGSGKQSSGSGSHFSRETGRSSRSEKDTRSKL
jgi:hypothetical protein